MWKILSFINERKASFTFVIGSLVYGFYHFFNTNIISQSAAYTITDDLFIFIGGRAFGSIFIIISALKLYAIIFEKVQMKISLYFILLSLWIILGVCFLISFLEGNANAAWIYCFTIAAFSTSIISQTNIMLKGHKYG